MRVVYRVNPRVFVIDWYVRVDIHQQYIQQCVVFIYHVVCSVKNNERFWHPVELFDEERRRHLVCHHA